MATWYTHCVDTLHLCMWICGRQYKASLHSVAEGVRVSGTLLLELLTLWRWRGHTSAAVWLDMLQFERKRDVLSIERSFISESQFWSNNTGDVPVIAFKQSCSCKHTRPSPLNPKLLTPWSRVLFEQLTGFQLVKKLTVFHGNRMVHYRTHKRPSPVSIPGQPNPVRVVWLGWYPYADTTPPEPKAQPNTNTHRTRAIRPMK